MASLLRELVVGLERKVSWIIGGDFQAIFIFQYGRMVGAKEWYIMSSVPGIWNTNTFDHTHVARENGVVTFHMQNHGNHWNISKDGNKVCMQRKHFILFNVKCSDAGKKFEEFHDEGVGV